MPFPLDAVMVNFGMERLKHLARCSMEHHPGSSARDIVDTEAFGLEPGRYFFQVVLIYPKAAGILFRRQPIEIVWRGWIALLLEQIEKFAGLARRGFKHQREARDPIKRVERPFIVLNERPWGPVPYENLGP